MLLDSIQLANTPHIHHELVIHAADASAVFYRSESVYDLPTADLDGELHPLVAASNFHTEGTPDGPVPTYIFPTLAFQLVTRLIEIALPFFYIVFLDEKRWHGGKLILRAIPSTLTDEQKHQTRDKLTELAQGVSLLVADLSGVDNYGRTLPGANRIPGLEGVGSQIVLSAELLTRIQTAETEGDMIQSLVSSLTLAAVLLHELGHASAFASDRFHDGNAFVGDSISNEIGFELQNYLFNGIFTEQAVSFTGPMYSLNNVPSKLDFMLVAKEWPNAATLRNYLTNGGANVLPDTELPCAFLLWHVSFLYVAQFFRQSFWQGVGSVRDLHLPRTVGRARVIAGMMASFGEVRRDLIPTGFRLTDEGNILPL